MEGGMEGDGRMVPPPLPGADVIGGRVAGLRYPLTLSFKILALASQASVTDADGRGVLYVRQKLLKLREHVEVFADATRGERLADIRANKVIDWSARYRITDAAGSEIGSVGRRGWKSLWRAHYEAFNPGAQAPDYVLREEDPWVKVADSLLSAIPVVGMMSGYFCHPRYLATRAADGAPAMRMTKQAAFWEGRFRFDKLAELGPREELNLLLSFLMLVLLERSRG